MNAHGGRRLRDREEAGALLAEKVAPRFASAPEEVVVLALPRGGVPVGFEVARRLGAPLEVFVARKVGAPGQPEFGIGAIAEGDGAFVVDERSVNSLRLTPDHLAQLVARERDELRRRVEHYRGDRPLPDTTGRHVVLVDDGLATGVTAEAALRALRVRQPASLILAVPACAPQSAQRLRRSGAADDVVSVLEPTTFHAVGQWYEHFDQTTDREVLARLEAARAPAGR